MILAGVEVENQNRSMGTTIRPGVLELEHGYQNWSKAPELEQTAMNWVPCTQYQICELEVLKGMHA